MPAGYGAIPWAVWPGSHPAAGMLTRSLFEGYNVTSPFEGPMLNRSGSLAEEGASGPKLDWPRPMPSDRSQDEGYSTVMTIASRSTSLPSVVLPTTVCAVVLSLSLSAGVSRAFGQGFTVGEPIGSVNEAGERVPMSDNVKVYGSFHFSESCTFDPQRNLILAMNNGERGDGTENDGFVSLINPDGSVHTPKWIGVTRDGLELHHPLGSAIANGVLYTVDVGFVRSFDLQSGRPVKSVRIPDSTLLNGIAVANDGTIYTSNTRNPELIYKVTADDQVSVFAQGAPLAQPNGVAMDTDGNIVVVNIGDNAVITYNPAGQVVRTEHAVESGNDGIVVLPDGTKYVSSVRYGSVSRIRRGEEAEIIASGIPSAASMCYDSVQNQLVIPMNPNYALAFVPL
jgi:hypothetical protein